MPGYILCIFLPFLALIILHGIAVVQNFRIYRAEQLAELRAEREQLEQEREASKKMMEELQSLREDLLAKQNGSPKEQ